MKSTSVIGWCNKYNASEWEAAFKITPNLWYDISQTHHTAASNHWICMAKVMAGLFSGHFYPQWVTATCGYYDSIPGQLLGKLQRRQLCHHGLYHGMTVWLYAKDWSDHVRARQRCPRICIPCPPGESIQYCYFVALRNELKKSGCHFNACTPVSIASKRWRALLTDTLTLNTNSERMHDNAYWSTGLFNHFY